MAGEGEETARVAGVSLGIVHYLTFSAISLRCCCCTGDRGERTAERVVPIYLWPGPGVGTTGTPWELDVEAGVRGACEVDAEGKQEDDCGEKGGHGGQKSGAPWCRERGQ